MKLKMLQNKIKQCKCEILKTNKLKIIKEHCDY